MHERKGHPPTTSEEAPKPEPERKEPSDSGYFNPAAASILLSVFKPGAAATPAGNQKHDAGPDGSGEPPPTTASVKFMITARDEQELRGLGYSQQQIDKLKPDQVAAILKDHIPPGDLP